MKLSRNLWTPENDHLHIYAWNWGLKLSQNTRAWKIVLFHNHGRRGFQVVSLLSKKSNRSCRCVIFLLFDPSCHICTIGALISSRRFFSSTEICVSKTMLGELVSNYWYLNYWYWSQLLVLVWYFKTRGRWSVCFESRNCIFDLSLCCRPVDRKTPET
jgi:hypothetical protein